MKAKRSPRFIATILIVRATRRVMRLLHLKATHFPGQLASRLCPDFLSRIEKPGHIIAITGTNGKTTVANLVADMAEKLGLSFAHNAYGSNIEEGIITALLDAATLTGRKKRPLAILEIDERVTRIVFKSLRPDYLLVTNLFRESYLRNAHGEFIFDILNESIPPSTQLILNADDLLSQQLGESRRHTSFGIARLPGEEAFNTSLIRDVNLCPRCQGPLTDDFIRYHHIGRSRCEACGWRSMIPDFEATAVSSGTLTLSNTLDNSEETYPFKGENILEAYNLLAAIALFRTLGYGREIIARILGEVAIGVTRKEIIQAGDKRIYRMLAKGKNPIAVSRVLDALCSLPGRKQFILLVDTSVKKMSEEDNTAWLYDTDLSILAAEEVTRIIVGGRRAEDIRTALLFAGLPPEKIRTCRDKSETGSLVKHSQGPETLAILYELYSEPVSRKVAASLQRVFSKAAAESGVKP
ncbi:MAG TPA: MurT ligase domain-containing protein [Bacillota bacterium]|nr:DUF1727 domain-containing protein [Fastidiosipila sp.]HPX93659.1 MurT ligase domain-containing protein [Bacillota bacterium]HQB81558.1 MurT ligase domain-containing protein [Bacillota bacterium]